jgi:hypothetical protein
LRLKGLNRRHFRCFGHERQGRGLTRTSRDSKVIKVNLISGRAAQPNSADVTKCLWNYVAASSINHTWQERLK